MATVYSYSKSIEVANSVGAYILNIQNDSLSNENSDGYFRVAVSGGSLGKVLNKGLSLNKEISEKIQWDKWIIFFSDERLVPLDHEDSNYGLLNSLVLKSLPDGKSPPKVITINEDLLKSGGSSEELASDYEKNLLQNFPSGEEIPSFDLILLGCGPDGHTCSLFPGHKLLKEDKKIIAHIDDSPKPPPKRITITFPILKKAKKYVIFYVTMVFYLTINTIIF